MRRQREQRQQQQRRPGEEKQQVVRGSRPPRELKYAVYVKLPFRRGDFVEPPLTNWTEDKSEALWNIITSRSSNTNINWAQLSTRFNVAVEFLLQMVNHLTERHTSRIREQILTATAAANAKQVNPPIPAPAQPAGVSQGHGLRRTGSGAGHRPPSALAVVREVSEEERSGSTGAGKPGRSAIPVRPQRPPVSRNSSSGSTAPPMPTQKQPIPRPSSRNAVPARPHPNPVSSPRPGGARLVSRTPTPTQLQPSTQINARSAGSPVAAYSQPTTTKTETRASSSPVLGQARPPPQPQPQPQPQPNSKSTGKTATRTSESSGRRYSLGKQQSQRPHPLQRPASRVNRPSSPAASRSSSDDDSDSSDDPNIHSRFLRRPPRFPLRDDPEDEDEPEAAFLPINHQHTSTSSSNDMGATLRGHFGGGLRSFGNRGSGGDSGQPTHSSLSQTSDSSASSAAFVDNPRRTTTTTSTRTTTGTRTDGSRAGGAGGQGPLSPRRTAELKGASREGSDGAGTPSMGSSFSDLDDASVTQSAMEEALASNMGGMADTTMASKMGSVMGGALGQAFKNRYLPKGGNR